MSNPCQYCKYPPSGDDVHRCQLSDPDACEPCRKLADLETRLKRMREAIIEMEEERLALKLEINTTHDTLTRRLPLEITAEILKLCLPDIMAFGINTTLTRYMLNAPLVLSAVSRRWSNIVRSTPQFWTDIPLYLPWSASKTRSLPVLAEEWLKRSGQLPLLINICIDTMRTDGFQELIEVLNRHSSRWTHLKYEGPSANMSHFSCSTEGISQLQTLSLRSLGTKPKMGTFSLRKFSVRPKCLKLVFIVLLKMVNIDWSHLTHLEIEYLCVSDCLEALRRAPLVTHCTLYPTRHEIGRHHFSWPQHPMVHDAIVDLTLVGTSFYDLLSHLLCPSLKTMVIKASDDRVYLAGSIVDFIRKSECPLTNLSLIDAELSANDFTSLCQGIPTLCNLHMILSRFPFNHQHTEHFFALLAEVSTVCGKIEPLYLPDLRSLTISQDEALDWTVLPAVFRIPQSSERHRRKLDFVEIGIVEPPLQFDDDAPVKSTRIRKGTWRQLALLKEQGVELKLHLQVGKKYWEKGCVLIFC